MDQKESYLDTEIKQLVIERLKTIPQDKKFSIGSKGDFTIEELIDNVKKDNEIGQKVIEVQMQFLQSLKKGILLDE